MVRCSLCGSEGTNASTCPLNPNAKNPNREKHPAAASSSAASSSVASSSVAVAAATPKLQLKKKPAASASTASAASAVSVAAISADAKRQFPDDKEMQESYVADMLGLSLPKVITGDKVDQAHKARMEQIAQEKKGMRDMCAKCLSAIKSRNLHKKAENWFAFANVCEECHRHISNLYHNPEFKEKYRAYHKGALLPVQTIEKYGAEDGYYNSTMYQGAKHWSDVAGRNAGRALP
jgi:hypothetical protein